MRLLPLLTLIACTGHPPTDPTPRSDPSWVWLTPVAQAERASLALRGVRPTPDELDRVVASPEILPELVDSWTRDARFLDTLRDLHHEAWWTRVDTFSEPPPAIGPLAWSTRTAIRDSMAEEPLRLVEAVVAQDRPYTDIVTADHTMIDAVLADAYGLTFDPDGPTWQAARYDDGRPDGGVMSTNGLWLRYMAADSNAQRSRGAFVAQALLCDDLSARDLNADATSPDDEERVQNDPACASCHQSLDPLSAHFFGVRRYVLPREIIAAFSRNCRGTNAPYCYPLDLYDPSRNDEWMDWGTSGPGFYGLPSDHLGDLGQHIAHDPRFLECTVRRFWSFFAQVPTDAIDRELLSGLTTGFVSSGHDARWLAAAVVQSAPFRASGSPAAGIHPIAPQTLRPEALARFVEDLTGFRWSRDLSTPDCETTQSAGCWGTEDLLSSDYHGFRSIGGGTDGWDITVPVHGPTPGRVLLVAAVAEQAAAHVVAADLNSDTPRLLDLVDADTTDPETIGAQIDTLVWRILGPDTDPDLAASLDVLWHTTHARHGGTTVAWEIVVAALLQDPEAWIY